jgi:hypothetical protein
MAASLLGISDVAVFGVLVGLAVVVGLLAEGAARHTRQAARAAEAAWLLAEAGRMRTALRTGSLMPAMDGSYR